MEWLTDPSVWLGLATLTLLEILLGIDNLVFVTILADRLKPHQRNAARQLGLGLALITRLLLLSTVFWMTKLTGPLLTLLGHEFSGRDLILLTGGTFLLMKATVEIHERLEFEPRKRRGSLPVASFGAAVAQIVILDAVFSVDSILTAIGMTDRLGVMMAAVILAIGVMLLTSKPLSEFVGAHPPLIILCLGFLLMVGFSLIADGVGFKIPKGYLYAAIGFSILIESFNQIALRNRRRRIAQVPRRQRVAETVVRLLSGLPPAPPNSSDGFAEAMLGRGSGDEVFAPAEKQMISGVLGLAGKSIGSIMTPRPEVGWVDLGDPHEKIFATLASSAHAQLLVGRGSIDTVTGVVRKQDLLERSINGRALEIAAVMQAPTVIYEGTSILNTLEVFKLTPVHMAVVVDEGGSVQGVVTQTDLLEAIAGDLPKPG
jgi:predicted tellurium resistance membrane protein TerC/CBS domain-containing protein